MQQEIAAVAAGLVVEEGLEYGPAKQRAVRQLGLPARTPLPGNDVLEDAVFDYIAVFCADTQPAELRALRRLALQWMERLQRFEPHLSGAVWHGSATRLSDIYLQLFCEDPKSAEIALIDLGVNYEVRNVRGLYRETIETLSFSVICRELGETVGIHLSIYDLDDLRGALVRDSKNRPPRGNLNAIKRILSDKDRC